MSVCNLTKNIPSNQCIGDSLRVINNNFASLDTSVCNIPLVVGDNNVVISSGSDQYQRPVTQISTETPITYQTDFTYKSSVVTKSDIGLDDDTTCSGYVFPYSKNWYVTRPFGSFETISTGSGYPQVTLYWMTSSDNASTVFATNSATATSRIDFNDSITALYKEENTLYIGGSFTSINGVDTNKFAVMDLQSGVYNTTFGFCGTLMYNPLSGALRNLGTTGSVDCILKQTINISPLLIIGGSFHSETLGRGLVIYDETLDLFYSFYVNGSVHNMYIAGTELFIVGNFDYINYGAFAATETSKQRVYCNGITKIALQTLLASPFFAIDTNFCENIVKTFASPTKVYCVAEQNGYLYVGGDFKVVNEDGEIISQNIAVFETQTGTYNANWLYIFNRPVLTMYIDNPASILYIGGEFTTLISHRELYTLKRQISEQDTYSRAVAFSLKLPQLPGLITLWRPRFNNAVSKFIASDSEVTSELYAMGQFTELNDNSVGYIAAVTKATEFVTFGSSGRFIPWNLYLSTAPTKFTNALFKTPGELMSTLFVGGNFTSVNGEERRYLANVAGVGQNIEPYSPSTVAFDVGGHVASQNQHLKLNFETGVRQVAETGPYGKANKVTLPPIVDGFKGLTKNQLCRFYIRRPGNAPQIGTLPSTDDLYREEIYVLGWSVNFDSQKDI
jgi:hypothetical protein